MWAKEKFYRLILFKKYNFILLFIFCNLFFSNNAKADLQEELIKKYTSINTLHFNFTQKVGDKIELGKCYIKYPLLMKCEYPKKKKIIIADGKKFAVIKKRYKKIYLYPLKKTPLFYILNKENILHAIKNYEPKLINSDIIEYKLTDNNSNKVNIFFNKNSLNLAGWKTTDAYSNEVSFVITNLEANIPIKNETFKIPREDEL